MKKAQVEQKVKSLKFNFIAAAILYLVLGVVLLVWPDTSSSIICYTIGAVLLLCGAAGIISFLRSEEKTALLALQMVVGVIAAALGVFFLTQPKMMLSILPTLMGLFIIVVSIPSAKRAFDLRSYREDKWWINLVLALAAIALGALIFFHPYMAAKFVMRLIGGVFFYVGACDLWGIWRVSHAAKGALMRSWPDKTE